MSTPHADRTALVAARSPVAADRLNAVAVIVLTACVLGMTAVALVRGQQAVALGLATLATVCVTAIARPRLYRMVALGGMLAVPLMNAIPSLHPQDYDYLIYVGALALLLVGLGVFQQRPIPPTLGTAFLGYALISGWVAASLTYGIADGIRAVSPLVASFAAYILVLRSDASERRWLLGGLFLLGSIESAIAILQVLTGWPVFSGVLPTLFQEDRNYFAYLIPGIGARVTLGSGTFYHFNLLGSVLALLVPIAFALWLQQTGSIARLGLFALLAAGAVATFSRGALLSITVGIALLLFTEYRRGRRQGSVVILSALGVGAVLLLNVVTRYTEATGNISTRRATWLYAINDALERPSNLLFGFGYEHFQSAVLTTGNKFEAVRTHVLTLLHSGTLQLLLEFGIVGLVLFILWIIVAVDDSRTSSESFLVRGLVAGVIAFVIYQTVENILFAYPGVLFVTVVACLEAETAARKSAASSDDTDLLEPGSGGLPNTRRLQREGVE